MDYRTGKVGRTLAIRFDDGEDFLQGITDIVKKEDIQSGWFIMLGGLREADIVTGPKEVTIPPEPVWSRVADGARELVGLGSVFRDETNAPKIHLHSALGHHGHTLTGCLRKGTKTYLTIEVYLTEIVGIEATRPWFAAGQFNRLTFH